jgi:cytochrome c oxidase cbb3-type subunit IV
MEIYSMLGSIFTVISFVVFIGIVAWAYSSRRKQAFDVAAQEPFALPDETEGARAGRAPGAPR